MLKHEIAPGMIRYGFPPLSSHKFGTNIFALVSGGNALLIDTGYSFQGEQAFEDIKKTGVSIKSVIISHFHIDHMEGLKLLSGVPVYGSGRCKESLDLWTERQDHHFYSPAVTINDTYTFNFGEHVLNLIPFPGHSPCTILTAIDGRYLHIADELIFSEAGEPVLPITDPGCIQRHADALQRLKGYAGYIMLPSHGPVLSGKESIISAIDNCLCYYNTVLGAKGKITYEEAARGCGRGFLHSEWHADIYE